MLLANCPSTSTVEEEGSLWPGEDKSSCPNDGSSNIRYLTTIHHAAFTAVGLHHILKQHTKMVTPFQEIAASL